MTDIIASPGPVVLIGSGETSPASGAVFEKLAKGYETPLRLAILETPAGFELNSSRVAGRVGEFLATRLQNYHPVVNVIPARKKGGEDSPDNEAILEPLYTADLIFLGPGSPTYTMRQLQGSLAYEIIRARQLAGASLVLASAATIAFGARTMPVYEIFKAGMDIHWQPGLNFFRPFGLNMVIIPHWNNTEGGQELDTSRCFMGEERFNRLREKLDTGMDILGIDEHTSLWLDPVSHQTRVYGKGKVHLICQGVEQEFSAGQPVPVFPELGSVSNVDLFEGIRQSIRDKVLEVNVVKDAGEVSEQVPDYLLELLNQRETARKTGDYSLADNLRKMIDDAGWRVMDTASGSRLEQSK